MSESKIEWTDYTFNPWSGCEKVSAGCKHCYAQALPRHMRRGAEWGPDAERVPASEDYWKAPLRWAKAAAKEGVRKRVFCASVADVFEVRLDLDPLRERLWGLIKTTLELDWLLLTKRPAKMATWAAEHGWPDNAWAGASVENQDAADHRLPHLLDVPARVRFVSCEPLLGPVDLLPWLTEGWYGRSPPIHWIIVGGESGRHPRPMSATWARSLRDQAATADVPFLFKQWGCYAPVEPGSEPAGERIMVDGALMERRDRKEAGRLLDGVLHDGFPT